MRALIYSAIYGGYDAIKEQPKQSVPTDYLLYYPRAAFSRTWTVRKEPMPGVHPRIAAKYWKTHPPKGYDLTVWVDGSAKIKSEELVSYLDSLMPDNSVAAFVHPERDCVYDEADHCYQMPKYASQPVISQVRHYLKQGYPTEHGLFACGLVARKGDTRRFDHYWWKQNLDWTWQDQLSFPYVAWRQQAAVIPIQLSQYDNPYVVFLTDKHKSNL